MLKRKGLQIDGLRGALRVGEVRRNETGTLPAEPGLEITAAENDAGAKPLRERTGTSARCNGISSDRLCGDARALDGAAQIETRRGTQVAQTEASERGAVAIAICAVA